MPYKYTPPTGYSPQRSRADITDEFRKWNAQAGETVLTDYDLPLANQGQIAATIRFQLRGAQIAVKIDRWPDFATNLRAAYLNIRDMRLAEARGSLESMREALLMLSPGKRTRDPYAVLGVREDASPDVIDAAYKAMARAAHSDRGGDDEAMKEVNEAYDKLKGKRAS